MEPTIDSAHPPGHRRRPPADHDKKTRVLGDHVQAPPAAGVGGGLPLPRQDVPDPGQRPDRRGGRRPAVERVEDRPAGGLLILLAGRAGGRSSWCRCSGSRRYQRGALAPDEAYPSLALRAGLRQPAHFRRTHSHASSATNTPNTHHDCRSGRSTNYSRVAVWAASASSSSSTVSTVYTFPPLACGESPPAAAGSRTGRPVPRCPAAAPRTCTAASSPGRPAPAGRAAGPPTRGCPVRPRTCPGVRSRSFAGQVPRPALGVRQRDQPGRRLLARRPRPAAARPAPPSARSARASSPLSAVRTTTSTSCPPVYVGSRVPNRIVPGRVRRRQQPVRRRPLGHLAPEPVVEVVAGLEPPPPRRIDADVQHPAEPVVLPGDDRRSRGAPPGHRGQHLGPVLRLADDRPVVRRESVPRLPARRRPLSPIDRNQLRSPSGVIAERNPSALVEHLRVLDRQQLPERVGVVRRRRPAASPACRRRSPASRPASATYFSIRSRSAGENCVGSTSPRTTQSYDVSTSGSSGIFAAGVPIFRSSSSLAIGPIRGWRKTTLRTSMFGSRPRQVCR